MGMFGEVAKGAATGYAVGSFFADPRSTSRKAVAAAFTIVAAFFMILLTSLMQLMGSDGDTEKNMATSPWGIVMSLVIVIAGAKFLTKAPFSVFKFPLHLIASFRTSIPCIVGWVVLVLLMIPTFFIVKSPGGLFFLDLLVIVVSFVVGGLSVSDIKKIQQGGSAVQTGVARAMNAAPEAVQLTWTGALHKPTYIVALPYVLQREALPMLHQNLAHALPNHQVIDLNEHQVVLAQA
ncbi:hypothetical protein [Brevibacterium moorei]|uniref:hypothetical protein n=1 Tax=Brevibacterium moorei TaxID=2968457 RepID=UPI00211C6C28|nr:hypothetical protein [Brevibacterium sp. 68QC2CO]MCQ9386076.1 hypothetical protein [Brevibacterium sp. 68QC2CO]